MEAKKRMARFNATRFTHQDTSEYGQGKKVTTKILETDARNTEYLLGELQELKQQITPTLVQTYAPIQDRPTQRQNMQTNTITEQDITDNKGKTHHLQPQTLWQTTGNETTASLETTHIITPGTITQINAPTINTGTTTCTKRIITGAITREYTILGTLTEITGSNTGEVTSNSLIQQYYNEVQPSTQWTSFSSYDNFLAWVGQVNWYDGSYPFGDWLSLKHQKTFYGVPQQRVVTPWAIGAMEVRLNNESETRECTYTLGTPEVVIPLLASVPTDYEGGDVLKIHAKYRLNIGAEEDVINFSTDITEILVSETPEDNILEVELDSMPAKEALRVYKNNIELFQQVDYNYNTKTRTVRILGVEQDDFIEISRAISGIPRDIQIQYFFTREDTQSQGMILPVQVKYVPDPEE